MEHLLEDKINNQKYVSLDAEMYHFETWVQKTDPVSIKVDFQNILQESGFTIVNFIEHRFPVEGFTCVWLLAESHLAIHTFPNSKKSFVQLSSCNFEKRNTFEKLIGEFV